MEPSGSIKNSILKKNLQNVIVKDSGEIEGVFIFPADFPAFAGHFPGQPVLPAVVQLAAVRLLAARHLKQELAPITVARAKFKSMVGPDEPMTVTVTLDQSGDVVTIPFVIAKEQVRVSTGTIICRTCSDTGKVT